jgi:hypothetical protein
MSTGLEIRTGMYEPVPLRRVAEDGDTHAALLTCYMRGWVEPLERAVPSSKLSPSGSLPPNFSFEKMETFYRLTSAGWSVIHRSDLIATCALLISAMSFALAIFGVTHH